MIFRCLLVLFSVTFCSCHFLGSRDEGNDTPISSTDLENFHGVWHGTDVTYNLLKEKKYKLDSITLMLHKDSTFEFRNLPDCINNSFGDPLNHKLVNANGKWRLYKFDGKWKLQMSFDQNEIFDNKIFMDFEIALVGSELKCWHYIGDPDQADVLELEKER